jgi:hypothetical protein
MKPIERLLLCLEMRPCDMLYRAVIGFGIVMPLSRLWRKNGAASEWVLVLALTAVLLVLRAVPAVVRKVVPFSRTAQDVWRRRRDMAKFYDSYQWRKLLGFGTGLALGTVFSGRFSSAAVTVPFVCIMCGTAGAVRWRAISREASVRELANGANLSSQRTIG